MCRPVINAETEKKKRGNKVELTEWLVFGCLAGLALYDIKWKQVSVPVVVTAVILVTVYRLFSGTGITELLAGLIPGIGLLLTAFFTKESIGTGDGLTLCVLGLFCGMQRALAILGMALVISAVLAMVLLVLKRAGRKTELPFLPCLCTGYLLCYLW